MSRSGKSATDGVVLFVRSQVFHAGWAPLLFRFQRLSRFLEELLLQLGRYRICFYPGNRLRNSFGPYILQGCAPGGGCPRSVAAIVIGIAGIPPDPCAQPRGKRQTL